MREATEAEKDRYTERMFDDSAWVKGKNVLPRHNYSVLLDTQFDKYSYREWPIVDCDSDRWVVIL